MLDKWTDNVMIYIPPFVTTKTVKSVVGTVGWQ